MLDATFLLIGSLMIFLAIIGFLWPYIKVIVAAVIATILLITLGGCAAPNNSHEFAAISHQLNKEMNK